MMLAIWGAILGVAIYGLFANLGSPWMVLYIIVAVVAAASWHRAWLDAWEDDRE
jgi:small basic protein